jgi:hypothetical protein
MELSSFFLVMDGNNHTTGQLSTIHPVSEVYVEFVKNTLKKKYY